MMTVLRGKAWVVGDNLDTDYELCDRDKLQNIPRGKRTLEDYGRYCMTVVDPDFPKEVKKGDFFIAGTNCGMGHDHATGPLAIKGCGFAGVIAESAVPWFLRNCILLGLPAIEYEGIKKKVKQGDELEIDFSKGTLTNLTTGETLKFEPIPKFLLDVIDAGNLPTYLKNKIDSDTLDTYLE